MRKQCSPTSDSDAAPNSSHSNHESYSAPIPFFLGSLSNKNSIRQSRRHNIHDWILITRRVSITYIKTTASRDPAKPWSFDVLLKILEETLNLAKMRCVDLGDLPRLGRVLPAISSGNNLTESLARAGAHS